MAKAQLIAERERELLVVIEQMEALQAKMNGLIAELDFLKSGTSSADALVAMSRTDAIVSVLRKQGSPLSPMEIRERLVAVGRDDKYNSVTATLKHLRTMKRVHCPSDGRYAAC